MNYERLLRMKKELKNIKSDFVSITKYDYNNLLKISKEEFTCINNENEIELDTDDLKVLVSKCLSFYES